MNTTELAKELDLSKGRISQLVSAGKLEGCFEGDGRARRFDLDKVREALKQRLDPGQMMGNGRGTKKRIADGAAGTSERKRDGVLAPQDPDRYEMARTQKAEEEARTLRRRNQEAEGTLVLAQRAEQVTARLVAQEIAEFEGVLSRGARAIADKMGVDFKAARQILIDLWREHRHGRATHHAQAADQAKLTDDETAADF